METSKVLILITSRSEQPVGSCNVPYLRTIRLDRLDKGSIADLVAHVDDERVLDESMRAQVVARANGVALFAQELTRCWSPRALGPATPPSRQPCMTR